MGCRKLRERVAPEGHACQLAVEGREHFAHRLGRTSRGWDDVGAGAAAATPILLGRAVNRLLSGCCGVHSRHQTLHTKQPVKNIPA